LGVVFNGRDHTGPLLFLLSLLQKFWSFARQLGEPVGTFLSLPFSPLFSPSTCRRRSFVYRYRIRMRAQSVIFPTLPSPFEDRLALHEMAVRGSRILRDHRPPSRFASYLRPTPQAGSIEIVPLFFPSFSSSLFLLGPPRVRRPRLQAFAWALQCVETRRRASPLLSFPPFPLRPGAKTGATRLRIFAAESGRRSSPFFPFPPLHVTSKSLSLLPAGSYLPLTAKRSSHSFPFPPSSRG